MKKNITTHLAATLLALLVLCSNLVVMATDISVAEKDVQPRYVGVTTVTVSLDIYSDDWASCGATILPVPGYTIDWTYELQKDEKNIVAWSGAGTSYTRVTRGYFVDAGFEYTGVLTVNVYDSNGNWVETIKKESSTVNY